MKRGMLIGIIFGIFVIILIVLVAIILMNNNSSCYNRNKCEYCSMENNCPNDKCYTQTSCVGNNKDTFEGCVAGPVSCHYKNPYLKTDYIEYNSQKAKECLVKFISDNSENLTKLNYLQTTNIELPEENSPCSTLSFKNIDEKDEYCWFFSLVSYTIPPDNKSYVVQFFVGAQTCNVYLLN